MINKECHKSCKQCTGPSDASCVACKKGWTMNKESQVCEDINECIFDKDNSCDIEEYCENTEGSFLCHDCDVSCSACTGTGNDKCLKCKKGYRSTSVNGLVCDDIDECLETPNICKDAQKKCVNKPGSFECKPSEYI